MRHDAMTPAFERYVGIDYSGAATADTGLPGLRVFVADGPGSPAAEVTAPPAVRSRHWTRRGVAAWLDGILAEERATLVGIDHAFSFPRRYFDGAGLAPDWDAFLDDIAHRWPTDEAGVSVRDVRRRLQTDGSRPPDDARWRRVTERRTGGAKSVFHFDVPGSVASSTHAGLPWLRRLRRRHGRRVRFWPFDGWRVAAGASAVAEVYPALWSAGFARGERTGDQHDAYSIAEWLRRADRDGRLAAVLEPRLDEDARDAARLEGWILGVT